MRWLRCNRTVGRWSIRIIGLTRSTLTSTLVVNSLLLLGLSSMYPHKFLESLKNMWTWHSFISVNHLILLPHQSRCFWRSFYQSYQKLQVCLLFCAHCLTRGNRWYIYKIMYKKVWWLQKVKNSYILQGDYFEGKKCVKFWFEINFVTPVLQILTHHVNIPKN